jgi:hypothetical protein
VRRLAWDAGAARGTAPSACGGGQHRVVVGDEAAHGGRKPIPQLMPTAGGRRFAEPARVALAIVGPRCCGLEGGPGPP